MSIATEISRLQQAKVDLEQAINELAGVNLVTNQTIDDYAPLLGQVNAPALLLDKTYTLRLPGGTTMTLVGNDNMRIRAKDTTDEVQDFTIDAWNALWAEAGFDKDAMDWEPIGLRVLAFDNDEVYLFDRYEGVTYNPSGEAAAVAGRLQHSPYNNNLVTAAGSGTDFTTGKAWTVTESGNNLVLYEANTGCSWTIAKNTGAEYSHKAFGPEMFARTYSLWAQCEWMRHRMAIDSGLTTTEADGTLTTVDILNASGAQAAVGEDMYFWINGTNTGLLAKYNLNNRHTVNGYNLTSAIADAIYAAQKAQGVNMNDTGVNSSTKPVLAPGSKGAEAIAVNGKWYIITPFITNPNATTATLTNNLADAPAVYWASNKGCNLPSDALLYALWINKAKADAIITYLNQREGRSIPVLPLGEYTWSGVRYSAYYSWVVYLSNGSLNSLNTYLRCYCVGSSAS